jgi:uncharacterized protein YndB with AHSA1/START domain
MAHTQDVSQAISDESVREKTGRGWAEWFAILDAFDCAAQGHTATARFLAEEHGVSAWWSQAVTVRYELERGLRLPGQRDDGFELSVQRTIGAPVERAFAAWAEPARLNGWFTSAAEQDFREGGRYQNGDDDRGEFRKIVPQQLIRFTWENPQHRPGSVVEVQFEDKGAEKSTVRLTHSRLSSPEEVENLREGWSWALDSLKSYLETGKGISYDTWAAER